MLRSGLILATQFLLGIMLLVSGWGFDDVSGFFRNPARLGLVAAAFVALVAAAFFRLELGSLRRGSGPAGNENLQLGSLLLMSLLLLWFLPFADRRGIFAFQRSCWRYAGLVCFCAGIIVRLLALRELGDCFSVYVTLQANHRLVRDGIYRKIRHPLYLSLLLAPAGVGLVFASWLALPILLLAAGFIADRMAKEEQLLAAHFGAEFQDYQRRSWKLIPRLL